MTNNLLNLLFYLNFLVVLKFRDILTFIIGVEITFFVFKRTSPLPDIKESLSSSVVSKDGEVPPVPMESFLLSPFDTARG